MSLLSDEIMKALEMIKPKMAPAFAGTGYYASGCGCTGNCGQSCVGSCADSCEDTCNVACSGNCGRSCSGNLS